MLFESAFISVARVCVNQNSLAIEHALFEGTFVDLVLNRKVESPFIVEEAVKADIALEIATILIELHSGMLPKGQVVLEGPLVSQLWRHLIQGCNNLAVLVVWVLVFDFVFSKHRVRLARFLSNSDVTPKRPLVGVAIIENVLCTFVFLLVLQNLTNVNIPISELNSCFDTVHSVSLKVTIIECAVPEAHLAEAVELPIFQLACK